MTAHHASLQPFIDKPPVTPGMSADYQQLVNQFALQLLRWIEPSIGGILAPLRPEAAPEASDHFYHSLKKACLRLSTEVPRNRAFAEFVYQTRPGQFDGARQQMMNESWHQEMISIAVDVLVNDAAEAAVNVVNLAFNRAEEKLNPGPLLAFQVAPSSLRTALDRASDLLPKEFAGRPQLIAAAAFHDVLKERLQPARQSPTTPGSEEEANALVAWLQHALTAEQQACELGLITSRQRPSSLLGWPRAVYDSLALMAYWQKLQVWIPLLAPTPEPVKLYEQQSLVELLTTAHMWLHHSKAERVLTPIFEQARDELKSLTEQVTNGVRMREAEFQMVLSKALRDGPDDAQILRHLQRCRCIDTPQQGLSYLQLIHPEHYQLLASIKQDSE